MKIKEMISKFTHNNKKSFIALMIILITILGLGITYAFFKPFIESNSKTRLDVESYNTDQLTFTKGEDITINAEQQNFGPGMGNLSKETVGVARLIANKYTKSATQHYNVYFYIYDNEYAYTTDTNTPELVLTVIDPNGNELTSVDGLNYVTVGDVTGFDITTQIGVINIASDYEINTTSTTDGTMHIWKFKLTYVNLDSDQKENEGKMFKSELVLQKDSYQPTVAVYSETDNSLRFYNREDIIIKGTNYNGLMVSDIYAGFIKGLYESSSDLPWYSITYDVERVYFEDIIAPENTANWFNNFGIVEYMDLTNLDVSNVTDMNNMFYTAALDSEKVEIVGMDTWVTSNVTNMSQMFDYFGMYSYEIDIGDISNWDTSKVTDMSYMFDFFGSMYITELNIGDIGKWDVSKVENMSSMFEYIARDAELNIGDLGKWDVSSVEDMSNLFANAWMGATNWSVGDLSEWDTSNVKYMTGMFQTTGYNATTWNIGDISKWDVSNVTHMHYMFYNVGNYSQTMESMILDLSGWDLEKCESVNRIFDYNAAYYFHFEKIYVGYTNAYELLTNTEQQSKIERGKVYLNIPYDIENDGTVDGKVYANDAEGDLIFIGENGVLYKDIDSDDVYEIYISSYTVSFDANGGTGTMASQVFQKDVAQNINPNAFIKIGYDFLGWSTSAGGSVEYTNEQSITDFGKFVESFTLYAVWTPSTYKVAYNANGGTGTMSTITHTYGTAKTLTDNVFTRTGYTYSGWNTSADGSGTSYANKASVKNLTSTSGATVTLYAQWTPITYKVAYNANDGSGTMGTITHTYGTAKTLTANAFTRTGYAFAGWNTKADGSGTSYANNASVKNLTSTSGATVTLYAQWTAITYKVAYNANNGSGTMSTITHTYNTAKTLTANAFTRTGYTFAGWNTSADGSGTSYANKASVKNLTSTSGATVTLYAQWTAKTYKVAYNANGGSGTMSTITHTYDTAKTLTTNAFTRTGYTFAGWNTSADGSGTSYANKASVKNLSSTSGATVTLYAQWTAKTYKVAYNANGGSGTMSTITHTYDTAKALTNNAFTRAGYTFAGWNTKADGSGTSYANKASVKNLSSTSGATVTLYAQWSVQLTGIVSAVEDYYAYIYYVKDGALYYASNANTTSISSTKIISSGVTAVSVAGTQENMIYYIQNGALYYATNANTTSISSTKVVSSGVTAVSVAGSSYAYIYYVKDGNLYFASNANSASNISSKLIISGGVSNVAVAGTAYAYAYYIKDGNLYFASNANNASNISSKLLATGGVTDVSVAANSYSYAYYVQNGAMYFANSANTSSYTSTKIVSSGVTVAESAGKSYAYAYYVKDGDLYFGSKANTTSISGIKIVEDIIN